MKKIFILTLWRSGTHWLSNMLSYILEKKWYYHSEVGMICHEYTKETVNQLKNFPNDKILVRHISSCPSEILPFINNDIKLVFLFRDLRDVVVSTVYMRKFVEGYKKNHPPFPNMDFRDIFWWELGHNYNVYLQYVKEWYKTKHPMKIEVIYENLKKDTYKEIRNILTFLGFNINNLKIKEGIEKYSFNRVTGRNEGEANPFSHYRKGIIGGWREDLSKSDRNLLNVILKDALISLGYKPIFEFSQNIKSKIKKVLNSYNLKKKKIFIAGFGIHTIGILDLLKRTKVEGIVVNNAEELNGKTDYFGIPFISEENFVKNFKFKDDYYLLISSHSYEKEIFKRYILQHDFDREKIILLYNSKKDL